MGRLAIVCVVVITWSSTVLAQSNPIWTETFDAGVGRFDQTQLLGDSLFAWDGANQSISAEFPRDGAASRRLADIGSALHETDVFGFSVVVTPRERNTNTGIPNINVEGFLAFYDSTSNSHVGIKVRDSGFGVGNFGLSVDSNNFPGGDGTISWQRFHTYFIELLFDGPNNLITGTFYEGINSNGTLLGTETFPVQTGFVFTYDRLALSTNGLNNNPGSGDGFLRAGIDDFAFTVPEPSTAMLLMVGSLVALRRRRIQ